MANYKFCPICGSELTHREAGGRDRAACPVCGWVHYVNPVPGVGLVVEIEDGGQTGLVLIRRAHPPHAGRWALPSGYVEMDETAEEAAVREAAEETGLQVEVVDLAAVNSFPEGPPQSGIMLFYRVRPLGGALQAGDDAAEARVFRPGEFPLLPFRTHREMLVLWQAKFAHSGTSPQFEVRRGTRADDLEVMALLATLPPYRSLGRAGWQARAEAFHQQDDADLWVAVTAGAVQPQVIVGVLVQERTTGFVREMAVMPTFREYGIAERLRAAAGIRPHPPAPDAQNRPHPPAPSPLHGEGEKDSLTFEMR